MGPHPSVALVRRAVAAALSPAPPRVLVACSGGADSTALAAASAFVAARFGVAAGLVTVEHGLQPGSLRRALAVAALGYELGLNPVLVAPVRVEGGGGPEAAARAARYRALAEAAGALDADVLLGHTLDDQAETVLLGLGRGSGPRSIVGMRPATPIPGTGRRYLRPLLDVRRATTREACIALGLPFWDDPHNADPAFRRVRLRREVLPLLEDVLAGGAAEALARTAALLRDDLDALDAEADTRYRELRDNGTPAAPTQAAPTQAAPTQAAPTLDAVALGALPRAVRTRVLRRWAAEVGAAALAEPHLVALDGLLTNWHGQGPLDLPGGINARRVSGRLEAHPGEPPPGHAP